MFFNKVIRKNLRTTHMPDIKYDIIHPQNWQNFYEIPKIVKIYNTVLWIYFFVSIKKCKVFLYPLCVFDYQSRQNHLATSTFDTNNVFKISALPLILDTILWKPSLFEGNESSEKMKSNGWDNIFKCLYKSTA